MIKENYGFFLGGKFVEEGKRLEVINPYDDSIIANTYIPEEKHIEEAVSYAEQGFQVLKQMPTYERAELLRGIAEGIEARHKEFSFMIACESGKPIKDARNEVNRAINTFQNASEIIRHIQDEFFPLDLMSSAEGRWGLVRRFPLGVVLGIAPFNFPLNLVAHKVAPAIATKNSIIIKPARKTPLTGLLLAEVAREVGFPPGSFQVLPMTAEQAQKLAMDNRIKKLTFTGSADIGWKLKELVPNKRVTLELGGNAGVIVMPDCELSYVAERITRGAFAYAGQICISVQRVFIQENIYDRLLEMLIEKAESLILGDQLEEETDIGPMITKKDVDRISLWVAEAIADGAKVETGAEADAPFYYPTILTNVSEDMKVSCLEVFGPLYVIYKFKNFDEAIAGINNTVYGLQAGVFTHDSRLIFKAFEEIEVGGVIINDVPTFRVDHMPYGGVKASGFGREGLRYAMEEMTEIKLLALKP